MSLEKFEIDYLQLVVDGVICKASKKLMLDAISYIPCSRMWYLMKRTDIPKDIASKLTNTLIYLHEKNEYYYFDCVDKEITKIDVPEGDVAVLSRYFGYDSYNNYYDQYETEERKVESINAFVPPKTRICSEKALKTIFQRLTCPLTPSLPEGYSNGLVRSCNYPRATSIQPAEGIRSLALQVLAAELLTEQHTLKEPQDIDINKARAFILDRIVEDVNCLPTLIELAQKEDKPGERKKLSCLLFAAIEQNHAKSVQILLDSDYEILKIPNEIIMQSRSVTEQRQLEIAQRQAQIHQNRADYKSQRLNSLVAIPAPIDCDDAIFDTWLADKINILHTIEQKVSGIQKNERDNHGNTLLSLAINYNQRIEIIDFIVKNGGKLSLSSINEALILTVVNRHLLLGKPENPFYYHPWEIFPVLTGLYTQISPEILLSFLQHIGLVTHPHELLLLAINDRQSQDVLNTIMYVGGRLPLSCLSAQLVSFLVINKLIIQLETDDPFLILQCLAQTCPALHPEFLSVFLYMVKVNAPPSDLLYAAITFDQPQYVLDFIMGLGGKLNKLELDLILKIVDKSYRVEMSEGNPLVTLDALVDFSTPLPQEILLGFLNNIGLNIHGIYPNGDNLFSLAIRQELSQRLLNFIGYLGGRLVLSSLNYNLIQQIEKHNYLIEMQEKDPFMILSVLDPKTLGPEASQAIILQFLARINMGSALLEQAIETEEPDYVVNYLLARGESLDYLLTPELAKVITSPKDDKKSLTQAYKKLFKHTNDIDYLIKILSTLIKDTEHPLKIRREGVGGKHGVTTAYRDVMLAGRVKLYALLAENSNYQQFVDSNAAEIRAIFTTKLETAKETFAIFSARPFTDNAKEVLDFLFGKSSVKPACYSFKLSAESTATAAVGMRP